MPNYSFNLLWVVGHAGDDAHSSDEEKSFVHLRTISTQNISANVSKWHLCMLHLAAYKEKHLPALDNNPTKRETVPKHIR